MPLETYEQFESAARPLIQKFQYAQPPRGGNGEGSTGQDADGKAGLVRGRVHDGGIPVTSSYPGQGYSEPARQLINRTNRWGSYKPGRAFGTCATVSQILMVSYLVTGLRVPPLLPPVMNIRWTRAEGYLSKQTRLPPKAVNTEPSPAITSCACGTHPDHELELEEEDPDQLPPPAPPPTVNVRFDVVYNKSYNVPQLLFTAWDQSGAPLPLEHLLQYGILKPPPSARMVGSDLMPDQTSPFPLVQQTEHPTTGLRVWGVHPCNVAEAIHELVSAAQPGQTTSSSDPGHEVDDGDESGVGWLETWMMLSSSIVNLT